VPDVLASKLSREHAAELLRLERDELRRLRGLYEQGRLEVLGRLSEVHAETFTAQHVRTGRVQIERGLAAMVKKLGARQEKLTEELLEAGARQTLAEISHFEPKFRGGATGRIQLDALRRIAAPRNLLLHKYAASLKSYRFNLIGEVQSRLGVHIVKRSPWSEMTDDVAGRLQTSAIKGARFRAERIIRTEMVDALNAGHQAALEASSRSIPGLMRQWDSTLDVRTSDGCRSLNGTVRRIDEPWRWNGREIARPPLLPNCRSRVLPWHADWAEAAAELQRRAS
jgi:SPP1 gp7 family putative phage head morphogenesis protein